MKFSKMFKMRLLSMSIALAMLLSMGILTASAEEFSDTQSHWAASYIKTAVEKGFSSGYDDGKFRPDQSVTRAEFIKMVNKAIGLTITTDTAFSDVTENDWFFNDVKTAVGAGYIKGNGDGTFLPNKTITRQEAAVVLSRVVTKAENAADVSAFTDVGDIADWAKDSIAKIAGKSYMTGYPEGTYKPLAPLTRAEAVKIICSVLEKEKIVSEPQTLSASGATLDPAIYTGGVTIAKEVEDGEVTISGASILSELNIQGGGVNSVHAVDCILAFTVINREGNPVRLEITGQSIVNSVVAANDAIIDALQNTGASINVMVSAANSGEITVTVSGNVQDMTVNGKANVTVASGTVSNLVVASTAEGAKVTLSEGTTVASAQINAAATFEGSGSMTNVNETTTGSTFSDTLTVTKSGSTSEEETPGETTPGGTTPGDTTPGGTTPGGTTPGGSTPGGPSGGGSQPTFTYNVTGMKVNVSGGTSISATSSSNVWTFNLSSLADTAVLTGGIVSTDGDATLVVPALTSIFTNKTYTIDELLSLLIGKTLDTSHSVLAEAIKAKYTSSTSTAFPSGISMGKIREFLGASETLTCSVNGVALTIKFTIDK